MNLRIYTKFGLLFLLNFQFIDYNRDKDRLINRSKQIANIVNTVSN